MMIEAVKHCIANLANFNGQDDRPTFWWWVLAVFVVTFGISMIVSLTFVVGSMGDAFSAASSGASQGEIEAEMMQSMSGGLKTQTYVGMGVSLLGLALVLAAFGRRLRDAGLPVLLVVIPVITTLISSYQSIQLVDQMTEIMAAGDVAAMNEFSMNSASSGLIGWLGYLVVIVGGVWPSKSA